MNIDHRPERLRRLIDSVVTALDPDVDGTALAAQVFLRRFHFDRLIAAAIGEPAGAFRRRLLLERAAWQLLSGSQSVARVAANAGYQSVAGFVRAFSRAYGCPPGRFRRAGCGYRQPAPNGIHFHPPGGLSVPAAASKGRTMDLTDRLIEHDQWLTEQLIDRAATLPPAALDRPVRAIGQRMSFDADEPTVRSMLDRLVWTKENWNASVDGRATPSQSDQSIDGLRRRWRDARGEFSTLARAIRDRGDWDSGFVDALCEPPESLTFGGMLAHVVTSSAYHR